MNRSTAFVVATGVITVLTLFTFKQLFSQKTISRDRRKKAVFFGDSITQHGFNSNNSGWLGHLADWWVRRVDIINRGFSGYNSRWGIQIVEEVVVSENPDLVAVFFGANDAVDPQVGQHVPLPEYRLHMTAIVNVLRQQLPNAKLLLITPPPIWEPKLQEMNIGKGKLLALDRTNQKTLQYVNVVRDLGAQFHIPVVDIFVAMEGDKENSDGRAKYLSDGLHLTALGNVRLFETVKDTIAKNYPDFVSEAIPMHMLEWARMIEQDQQKALRSTK